MQYLNISKNLNIKALNADLKNQGYCLLKNFFEVKKISPLKTIVMDILQAEGFGERDGEYLLPIAPINRIGSEKFLSCIRHLLSAQEIHAISREGKLPELIKNLLATEVYAHPRKMIRITYPYQFNKNDLILPHQDLFYVKGEIDTLTCWIPLGNYTVKHGGLKVAQGSHKHGLFAVAPNSEGRFNCAAADLEQTNLDWRYFEYELGDLLVMHSLTLHAAAENLSNYFRLSLDCRFSALNGTINEEQLLPPYYPKLPDWDLLTADWGYQAFTIPNSLKIEKSDISLNDILSKPSKYI